MQLKARKQLSASIVSSEGEGEEVDLAVCDTIAQSSHRGALEIVGRNWAATEKTGFSRCDVAHQSTQLSLLLSLPQTTTVLQAEGTDTSDEIPQSYFTSFELKKLYRVMSGYKTGP